MAGGTVWKSDGTGTPATLHKAAGWSRVYRFDFSLFAEVQAGDTLSSPSVEAQAAGLTIAAPSVSGSSVLVRVSGGTDGSTYALTCSVSTSGSSSLSQIGLLAVGTATYGSLVVISGGGGTVTLAGAYDYITISGSVITRHQVDLTADVSGVLPPANLGTGSSITTKFLRGDGTWQAVSGGDLLAANNLSDVASASTARTNLGLGTAAVRNTGTSGTVVPLLDGANTWSADQTIVGQSISQGVVTNLVSSLNGVRLGDTAADHYLTVAAGSNLTTDRLLSLVTGDASRTLTISGDTTLGGGSHSGTNTGDQTNISGNAATVTTNANLTGPVTSVGNATTLKTEICIACSDETTALTTGTAKATFRMPFAMTLTAVRASVTTAPTGSGNLTVDINDSGTTVLSTKLTFDASEKTTTTAATPAVISDSALADDAEITIDIDAVSGTITGAGLKVWLIGTRAA